jgi:hypothetical protein
MAKRALLTGCNYPGRHGKGYLHGTFGRLRSDVDQFVVDLTSTWAVCMQAPSTP